MNHRVKFLSLILFFTIPLLSQVKPCINKNKWTLSNANSIDPIYDTIITLYTKTNNKESVFFYLAFKGNINTKNDTTYKLVENSKGKKVETRIILKTPWLCGGYFDLFNNVGELVQHQLKSVQFISNSNSFFENSNPICLSDSNALYNQKHYIYDTTSLLLFKTNNAWGGINNVGKVIILPEFNHIKYADYFGNITYINPLGSTIVAEKGKKLFVYDQKGIALTKKNYDQIDYFKFIDFSDKIYAHSRSGSKWGIINENFAEIIPPIYDTIIELSVWKNCSSYHPIVFFGYNDGKIIAKTSSLKWMMKDENNTDNFLMYTDSDEINYLSGGKLDLYSAFGTLTQPNISEISYEAVKYCRPISRINLFEAKTKNLDVGLFPYLNKETGFPVLENEFVPILIKSNNNWGAINQNGEIIIPIIYTEIKRFDTQLQSCYYAKGVETKTYLHNGKLIYTGTLDTILYRSYLVNEQEELERVFKINNKYYTSSKKENITFIDLVECHDSLRKAYPEELNNYDDPTRRSNEVFYNLKNSFGEKINKEFYSSINAIKSGFIVSKKDAALNNTYYGFADEYGIEKIAPVYQHIESLTQLGLKTTYQPELFTVTIYENNVYKTGLINSLGKVIIPINYWQITISDSTQLKIVNETESFMFDPSTGKRINN